MTTTLSCVVCGETKARLWRTGHDQLLHGEEPFRAVVCVRCGTRRLDPRPPAEEMARYYAPETYARAEEPGSEVGKRLDAYNARLAERADTLFPEKSELRRGLDVGCGDGRFLKALQARGWEVSGTETDPVAAGFARNRTNAPIFEETLDHVPLPLASLDLVSLLHVLEHVPDPRETLTDCLNLLRPGGAILIAVPNAASLEASLFGSAWYHLDLPRHYWGFTPHSLTRLLEEVGFSVSSLTYTPFLFAAQSLRNTLTPRPPLPQAGEGEIEKSETLPSSRLRERGPGGVREKLLSAFFLTLLPLTERLGKHIPGEIMEVVAFKQETHPR